ncbi:cytochrome P450 [Natrialba sp. PRR66]|uniref:cytochrome P450 n=1 Tax=Natrialba sp. PRR66 TaxID=3098146 RepID=UPI002B1D7691|nr:cytochrome P450 [Natrialba sp. PRR66]
MATSGQAGPVAQPNALSTREARLNPFPWYQEMREETPIRYDKDRKCWDVFRYDDVYNVLHDPQTFSSERPLTAQANDEADGMVFETMLNTDPPRHDELRKVVDDPFKPGAVKHLAPHIRDITNEYIDAVVDDNEMDIVADLATPLPVTVIAELIGVPSEDREQFKQWSDTIVEGPEAATVSAETVKEEQLQAQTEMATYFTELIEQRRAEPRDDLISDVIHAEVEGSTLSEGETLGFLALLLIAGNITTTNLITNAIRCFADLSDGIESVRDVASLELAVEEVLRYQSPIQAVSRVATIDTQLDGHDIEAGDRIVVWNGSANHDSDQFDDPDTFVPDRSPNQHLAFGSGVHFCLGAHLARLEARVALSTLFDRFETMHVSETKLQPVESTFLYGVQRLPVQFST